MPNATRLTLQEMVQATMRDAMDKLAEDESKKEEKVRKLLAHEKKEHGHVPSVKEEQAEYEKTASLTDPGYIEKLAEATDWLASNLDQVQFERGVLESAVEKLAGKPAPAAVHVAGSELKVEKSMDGKQQYKKDKPKTEDAAASQAGKPLHSARSGDGSAQLDNNMGKAPGQSGGSVPKAKYPEKGPLVNLGKEKKASSSLLGLLSQVQVPKGQTKTASDQWRDAVLQKMAGEDVMKANISASKSGGALVGQGVLSVHQAEDVPKQSGGPTSGFGNANRKHLQSNKAAIDMTKKDAKKDMVPQLGQVLEEPALNPKTDSKLQENLRNTGKAGVKIAGAQVLTKEAAKSLLSKIAGEGCQCNGNGECAYCKVKARVESKSASKEKTANAMMGYGPGSMGGGMGAAPPPPAAMGGGGMGAMAAGEVGADGCTCAGAGECEVCKKKALVAMLMAQKQKAMAAAPAAGPAPMAGAPVEKDSMGASPMGGF